MIGDLWWLMISDNNQPVKNSIISYSIMTSFLLFRHAVTPVETEEKFRQGINPTKIFTTFAVSSIW